ncbi:cytochrome c oxidase subunit II [Agromyces atrinae]|uniref:cytochrome-c oxidase n=1 Tax=Agromyces atrinae TaxID=592376 RepID=A0A4Q2M5C3_9MICO|nr:cytochrome c oxidase subunit II [Agromyces atrinae]MCI2958682.1 cytochrome c oxidase subunit II [Agromyces atrinae]NYD66101.1 cytochrome c oxidase subunit 2 [Agromyces atrinae]RXZ86447.1 cytochrome c oxidase subunit II [Agromyces atrinae]
MRNNRRLRWAAIPIAATLSLVLAGCTQAQLNGFLPGFEEGQPPVTNNTERVAGLWVTSWIVLLIVGLITWGLTIWAVIAYRRRKGQTGLPVQLRYNMPIEIFYTVVPLILVLGFFAFTARDQAAIEARFDEPDVTIEVVAKQWAWDFNYVDEDVYSPGIQAQLDPNGEPGSIDQSVLPTLYLPVGKKIEIELESRDVIHSFWVVDFLYKKDMYPGKTNIMSVIPEREGTYAGKCAELCGEYHSLMLFNVEVVSEAEYEDYIQSLRDLGQEGQLSSEYDRNTNLPGTGAPELKEEH